MWKADIRDFQISKVVFQSNFHQITYYDCRAPAAGLQLFGHKNEDIGLESCNATHSNQSTEDSCCMMTVLLLCKISLYEIKPLTVMDPGISELWSAVTTRQISWGISCTHACSNNLKNKPQTSNGGGREPVFDPHLLCHEAETLNQYISMLYMADILPRLRKTICNKSKLYMQQKKMA